MLRRASSPQVVLPAPGVGSSPPVTGERTESKKAGQILKPSGRRTNSPTEQCGLAVAAARTGDALAGRWNGESYVVDHFGNIDDSVDDRIGEQLSAGRFCIYPTGPGLHCNRSWVPGGAESLAMNKANNPAPYGIPLYLTEFSYMTDGAEGYPLTTSAHSSFSPIKLVSCTHHSGRVSLAWTLRFNLMEILI